MKSSPLLIAGMIFTLASTVALAQDPPPQNPPEAKASAAEAPEAKERTQAEKIEARRQGLISKTWWNHPKKVEEIGLSAKQRAEMDATLLAFLKGRQEGPKEQQNALSAFGEALAKGDDKAARGLGDRVAQAMSAPVSAQVDMMIKVATVLTPEQRKKLTSLYPKIFSRLWIRSGNPRSMMSGGNGGRRGG